MLFDKLQASTLGRVMDQAVLVPGFPNWKRVSNPRPVRVRFVVDTVALWPVSLPVLLTPLSVSFHQRSVFIFILIPLLSEGQAGICGNPLQ
jgi:hypothetical protein